MLAFCMVECIFYRLQHPAGTQGSETVSEALPQHPEISTSFPVVVLEFPVGKGLENFLEMQA